MAAGSRSSRLGDRGPAITIGASAADGFGLREPTGVAVEVRLESATRARPIAVDGWLVFADALDGRPAFVRETGDGVEDFVVSSASSLRYRVSLGDRVAGLRLASETLELLDAEGVPRLRMNPPYVIDAQGRRHAASLDLVGCAVDRSAALPFGRPPVPPGAHDCRLVVQWEAALAKPVLVDPSWSTTASMSVRRSGHGAAALGDDRVLVAGGNDGPLIHSSAEVFDGTSLTWASAGSMSGPRTGAGTIKLAGGRVLVAGGFGATGWPQRTAEVFEVATGWRAVASMNESRRDFAIANVGSRVLAVGHGHSAELFDIATETWSFTAKPLRHRAFGQAHAVGPDTALIYGGSTSGDTSTAELWTAGTWTDAGSTTVPGGASLTLPGNRVLVVGGQGLSTMVEMWSLGGGWKKMKALPLAIRCPTLALLPGGAVLEVGGQGPAYLSNANVFDPVAETWTAAGHLSQRRGSAVAATTSKGALIIGGESWVDDAQRALSTAELFGPFAPLGAACTAGWECASGTCADGVCCDSACDGPCESCTLEASRGTCRPIAGSAVHGACKAIGALPCGSAACDGMDGKACRKHPGTDTICRAPECRDGVAWAAGRCDGAGACASPAATPCAPYRCAGDTCGTSCTEDRDCVEGWGCDPATRRCRLSPPEPTDAGISDAALPDAAVVDASDDGGTIRYECGCRATGVGARPGVTWSLVAVTLATMARRRRRAPRGSRIAGLQARKSSCSGRADR